MDTMNWLAVVMRWLHILSAVLAVGVPIFMRFVLMPAANEALSTEQHAALREKIMGRWRKWVYSLITVFLVSGLYTFLVVARYKQMTADDQKVYQAIFGIKFLCALLIFFLASALAGRSAALAVFRKNARMWLNVNVALGILVIVLAGIMRYLPERDPVTLKALEIKQDVNRVFDK